MQQQEKTEAVLQKGRLLSVALGGSWQCPGDGPGLLPFICTSNPHLVTQHPAPRKPSLTVRLQSALSELGSQQSEACKSGCSKRGICRVGEE